MIDPYVAIPTMGWLRTELAEWCLKYNPRFYTNISPVSWARNKIVEDFLESSCNVLVMVDADTIPKEDALDKLFYLIASGADVATGITPIYKNGTTITNVRREVPQEMSFSMMPTEPFEVVGCGASCIAIQREVLEALQKPYFKTIEFDNGAYCSEDFFFCEKAREKGYTIVAHPNVICGHVKEIEL